jgi:peptidoglycan/xylan/chitin deacetylase (PgdA/CDA1 family)/GT2 family glycosyltransferase
VPAISVIIPTLNRPDQLLHTLDSLARQSCPPEAFETIVVIDGHDPETAASARAAPLPGLRVLEREHLGPSMARNAGAAVAQAAFLLFLDDDMEARPELVGAHIAAQEAHGRAVVIGSISLTVTPQADPFTHYFERTWSRRYRQFHEGTRVLTFRDCYSGNLSVPKDAFDVVGGFAPEIPRSHDVELGRRLEEHGLPFVFAAAAECTEVGERRFRHTASHFERAGMDGVVLYERHPELLERTELGLPWDPRPGTLLLFRALLVVRPPFRLLELADRFAGRHSESKWHGFLTRHLYWRGVRRSVSDDDLWKRLLYGTPILMYHAFGVDGEQPSRYIVTARRFSRQMAWLKRRGYHVLGLDEYVRCRTEYRLPPHKSIVITIDDGYLDNRTIADPILRSLGFRATLFPVSGLLGDRNRWSSNDTLEARQLLTWEQLKELQSRGMDIGAHTVSHPRLTELSAERAQREIKGSREQLQHELGTSVESFAYPFGVFDVSVAKLTEEAGFVAACSVKPGLNRARTSKFALRRAEIRGRDSMFRFALAVRFGDPDAMFSRKRG